MGSEPLIDQPQGSVARKNLHCRCGPRALTRLLRAGLLVSVVAPAAAAPAQALPEDAFGERAGVEQTGLYHEGAARGFELSNANVYRIEDTFFVRTAPLPDPILSRVRVKAGITAARAVLPSPSGVIEYGLRRATKNSLDLSIGYRDFGSAFAEVVGALRTGPELGISAGMLLQPDIRYADGVEGRQFDIGGVVEFTPSKGRELVAFGSASERGFGGFFGFVPAGPELPPVLPMSESYNPEWARFESRNYNAGAILKASLAPRLTLGISSHFARSDIEISDFTLFRFTGDDTAKTTLFRTPQRSVSGSGSEARLERSVQTGAVTHRIFGAARIRISDALVPRSVSVHLGEIDFRDRDYPAEPALGSGASPLEDRTRQLSATTAYSAQLEDRLEVRAGASLTRSAKTVRDRDGAFASELEEDHLLPYGSVIWSPRPALSVFASYVSGLEDSGIAPLSAANANAVLPPVRAEQLELGLRATLLNRLNISVAGFLVDKPAVGLDADRRYGFIGDAVHRGMEASVSGRISGSTSILSGLVIMDAAVKRAGGTAVPPGVSRTVAFARIDQQVPAVPGLAVDAQVGYQGPRFLDVGNTIETPGLFTLGAGLRQAITVARVPAELRVSASNLFNEVNWIAVPSGILLRNPPRSFRAFLTVRL